MGLLADPESGKLRFGGVFVRHHLLLGYVLYVVGLVWFVALSYSPFNAGTYFSENALLPGLVEPTFREEQHARSSFELLSQAAHECETGVSSKDGRKICWPFVEDLATEFRRLGLEVHTQSFNYSSPLMESGKYGLNLYAILRAPRHASTESIVFSTSYSSDPSEDTKAFPTLSLMLALAKRFRKATYWAKDIIFLAADRGEIGTQAWLEGYHEVTCGKKGSLSVQPLTGHAGSIQAALNLEFPSVPLSYVDVKVEGLNGQLPNLDLVTMVHKLCSKEGIRHTHRRASGHHNPESFQGFLSSAKTLLSMMTKGMGLGLPSGNHGLFLRFAIPAVTLRGYTSRKAHTIAGYTELGRAVEGMARCLNNLLERFHQSFFFYLLPASHRYVSIGLYFGPFAAMAVPLVLRALAIWLSFPSAQASLEELGDGDKEREDELDEERKRKAEEAEKLQDALVIDEAEEGCEVDYSAVGVLRPAVVCHAYGLVLAASPGVLAEKGAEMGFRPAEAVFLGFMAYGVTLLSSPLMQRWMTEGGKAVKKSRYLMIFVALMELALVLFTLALYNIATAAILTAVVVPFVLGTGPRKNWSKWVSRSLVLLLNPVILMLIASAVDTAVSSPARSLTSASEFVAAVFQDLSSSIERVLSSTYFYGHWLFYVVSLTLMPSWLLLWHSQFD